MPADNVIAMGQVLRSRLHRDPARYARLRTERQNEIKIQKQRHEAVKDVEQFYRTLLCPLPIGSIPLGRRGDIAA